MDGRTRTRDSKIESIGKVLTRLNQYLITVLLLDFHS
jgi:hypothetical protein